MTELEERTMAERAWDARDSAICRKTRVGAALITWDGRIYDGCNIEQDFCQSIHAEVCAISQMVCAGQTKFEHILIVSDIPNFYPCGGCLDWILQFGPTCKIVCSHDRNQKLIWHNVKKFMPFYPYKDI